MGSANFPSMQNLKSKIQNPSSPNPEFLHPATPEEFLPPISRWTTYGGLVLLAGFGAAIALAGVLKYSVTVKAPATIRPAGELRIVQSAVEGTVKSIEVRANSSVKAGDIIATTDDSRLQTKKLQLQGNIQQNQQQLTQIDAQIRALDSQIAAEKERASRAIASAEANLASTQRDLQDRQITASSEVQEAEANLRQAQKEFQKAQAELKSAEASLKSTEASLNAAIARRDRYQPLVESGGLSQDQFEEVKLAVEQQQQALESQKAAVEGQKQAIERQASAVEAAGARVKRVSAALNPSAAAVAMAREKIAEDKAAGESSIARFNQERTQLLGRKVELQNQVYSDKQDLQQLETELKNTTIRTPVSGTIQQLNLRSTSQVVRPGDGIAQIAPSEAALEIKVFVASGEIGKVKTGQTAHLRVGACPYPDYGTLKGAVTAISPDAMSPQGNNSSFLTGSTPRLQGGGGGSAGAYYEVTVEPESRLLSAGGRQCAIAAGMEGAAEIISREETVLTFLLRKARLLASL
jgi:HlyD family secretion protein